MSFDLKNFTNLYSLTKTLRFELKPVGKKLNEETGEDDELGIPSTLYWLRENMHFDKELQTFLKDQDIEDAYQVLKPVFDKLHEDFITKSLESDKAKELDISEYLKQYRTRQELKKKKSNEKEQVKKERIQKEIDRG